MLLAAFAAGSPATAQEIKATTAAPQTIVGAWVEFWKNSIGNERNGGTAKWDNTIATIGAGYVWKFAGNVYLNPWAAGHLMVGGPTSVKAGGAAYSPKRFTPEVSVKLGWHF